MEEKIKIEYVNKEELERKIKEMKEKIDESYVQWMRRMWDDMRDEIEK